MYRKPTATAGIGTVVLALSAIVAAIFALIASVAFVHLMLTAAQANWDGVPPWFNTSNFIGWVVAFIVTGVLLSILKAVSTLIQNVLFFPVRAYVLTILPTVDAFRKIRNLATAIVIISVIVGIVVSVVLTNLWFNFMSNHADLSSFFGEPSFIAYAGTFLLFTSILEGESKKKNEN